jgi:hypothetical protein
MTYTLSPALASPEVDEDEDEEGDGEFRISVERLFFENEQR